MHTDASMFVFGNTLYCYAQMKKVETQNFASHKQGYAINRCDYVPFIAEFFTRETQYFASLLGWRHHYYQ